MSDPTYCYPPDYTVLRNRFGIREPHALDIVERRFATQRARAGIPGGDLDLLHLRAIHRHLFQDVYDWAGELRTVEIAKGDTRFMPVRFIETGMADVHRRLRRAGYLVGTDRDAFADAAGEIIGDVNHVHPFREGNGRAQAHYLGRLAERAGHRLVLARLDPAGWLNASRASHLGDYGPMREAIRAVLVDRV